MKPSACYFAALFLSVITLSVSALAQTKPSALVNKPIDDARRVTLQGTVHPLAQPQHDLGPVPDSFPAERVLLLLNRPPEREVALQAFLTQAHRRVSPAFHHWLTPEQFGERFGPADADLLAATTWLKSHSFTVPRITRSRQFIEFSGTAGQLREAFHAEIHQYDIAGQTHFANANDMSIPEALAPLVRSVSPLNDFRAQPYISVAGTATYSRETKRAIPQWTIPNPFGTSNPYAYPIAPEDFATQYDLAPLYQAGINGSGQTIGIINESNIDLSLVSAYQQLFGLPANPTQVVIDGSDPGTLNGTDVEAYLDVEISGAVAPNATVNLYIADGSILEDPLALAAIRAVEDNQASVLSVSFGQCEAVLGTAGNQFWNSLWEQAAAQGQTVFVSSGDWGPYCNGIYFNQVSGIASTPWNIAVGGTDFYYSDYATGGASATSLWNETNDPNLGSLKAPVPEQVWNDPFGLDVISDGLQRGEVDAGGGGASSCAQPSSNTCSGYTKPGWQTGPGVPNDGARDIPDVSLFASNGANLSAYAICGFAGECVPNGSGGTSILLVGGTSASSPAMAGVMALINQKYGRQGQANFTLYPLAQQVPAAFHDITLGSNDSPCQQGTTDCALIPSGAYATTIFSAGTGYDQASGLGSIDAAMLVNNWNAITFLPTTTTLSLSSTKITHGSPITVTTSVSPPSGSGTPTGGVAILTTSPQPASQSQTVFTLNSGSAVGTVDFFPGGYYKVSAAYRGDAVFGGSTSSPVALTVTPENSNINFQVLNGFPPNPAVITTGGKVAYNSPLSLSIQPAGISAPAGKSNGNATGMATFQVDSETATVPLDSTGIASWNPPALAIGSHTASASYSGDSSFNASSSTSVTFSVTPGLVLLNDYEIGPYSEPTNSIGLTLNVGSTLTVGVVAQGWDTFAANPVQIPQGTPAPTGRVGVCLGLSPGLYAECQSPVYSQIFTLAPVAGINEIKSSGQVSFPNLAANTYWVSLVYSGDSVWGSVALLDTRPITVMSTPPTAATTTTVSITPASFSGLENAVVTTTVTGSGDPGTAPVGLVDLFDDGVFLTYFELPTGIAGTANSVSVSVNPSGFLNSGSNSLVAVYEGRGGNGPSVSSAINLTAVQTVGDFSLTPQVPQITVKPGNSGTVSLNLSSLSGFNGTLTLNCSPSSTKITCSVNPRTATLTGTATATLTVNAPAQTGAIAPHAPTLWSTTLTGSFVSAFVLLGSLGRNPRRRALIPTFGLCLFLLGAVGCGSGGSQTTQPPPPPPPSLTTYSVLVNATASNGIIHDAKVSVVVQ